MALKTFPVSLAVLVIAIAAINFFAHQYYWYRLFPWFDMMMHFAGGAWLSGTVIWWRYRRTPPDVKLPIKNLFFVGVGTALLVGVFWEGYEAVVASLVEGRVNALSDTLSDILFDALGALLAVFLARRGRLMV